MKQLLNTPHTTLSNCVFTFTSQPVSHGFFKTCQEISAWVLKVILRGLPGLGSEESAAAPPHQMLDCSQLNSLFDLL